MHILHTPEPWHVYGEVDGSWSIESNYGTVATVMAENCDLPGQVAADAVLIGAAPCLLKALEEAHAYLRLLLNSTADEATDNLTNYGEAVEERLFSAIAKATADPPVPRRC